MRKADLVFSFFFNLACLLVGLAANSFSSPNVNVSLVEDKIVGGQLAKENQFPYQVAIFRDGILWCGGSIISLRSVLTAAHCFFDEDSNPIPASAFTVRAGSLHALEGGQLFNTSTYYVQPDYKPTEHPNDIAVLQVSGIFTLGKSVWMIKLPVINSDPAVGTLCTVSGWGDIQFGSEGSDDLRYVEVPIIDRTMCGMYTETLLDSQLCAGYIEGGKDSCQADSGGPLAANEVFSFSPRVVVGVVSYGNGCASPGYPGIYTNVGSFVGWIIRYL